MLADLEQRRGIDARRALIVAAAAIALFGTALPFGSARAWFLAAGAVLALVSSVKAKPDLASWALLAFGAWSVARGGGFIEASAAVLCVALRSWSADEAIAKRVSDLLAFVVAMTALCVLLEASGVAIPWSIYRRPAGTIGDRNSLAAFLAISLPLVYARRAVAAIAVCALVLTMCRAAWLAAIVAGVIGLLERRRLAALTPAAIGVAAACLPWPGLYWREPQPISSALRLFDLTQGAGAARLAQAQEAIALMIAHPIGGAGAAKEPLFLEWARAGVELGQPALLLGGLFLFHLRRRLAAMIILLACAAPLAHPAVLAACAIIAGLIPHGPPARPWILSIALLGVLWPRAEAPPPSPIERRPPPLAEAATRAAEAAEVPRDLLLAIAYAEKRMSALGARPTWIPLRPWRAAHDRRTVSTSTIALPHDERELTIAAHLLARAARGVPWSDDALTWAPVLERWSGTRDPLADRLYAHQLLTLLHTGFRGIDDDRREILVPARGAPPPPIELPPRPAELAGASFVPHLAASPNTHRWPERTRPIRYIVIHTTQNDFTSIIAYFRGAQTGVGAHYLIRAGDGLAVQMIDERAVAFHDGCFNELSIGIEHEGYVEAGERWYSDALYASSARLARDIAARHQIPLDRAHILGHGEAPDCSTHTDPGTAWDWDRFMHLVTTRAD